MMYFVVVDADEHRSIIFQELPCQKKSRVHHRKPSGVIPATRLGIARKQIAFGVHLASQLKICFQRVCIVVGVNKILAGVVWRIDINQLDAPEIWLEKK